MWLPASEAGRKESFAGFTDRQTPIDSAGRDDIPHSFPGTEFLTTRSLIVEVKLFEIIGTMWGYGYPALLVSASSSTCFPQVSGGMSSQRLRTRWELVDLLNPQPWAHITQHRNTVRVDVLCLTSNNCPDASSCRDDRLRARIRLAPADYIAFCGLYFRLISARLGV